MLNKIIDIGIMIAESLFSICIIKIYFGTFFNKNKVSGIGVGLWGAYLLWQLIIQKYDLVPAYVNLVISVILTIMLAMILYQGNFLQKIAFSILINTIWLLSEFLTGYMIIICGEDYMVSKAFGAICSKIITLAICIMLKRFFEKETIVNLPQKYNILLLLIPTGSMYIIYNIFMLSVKINGTRIIEGAFASLILLLGLNTLIFKAYLLLSKEKELEKYNAVYAKQLEVCGRNINEREKIMLEFRNAKHDIKQHYTVLLKMLQNDIVHFFEIFQAIRFYNISLDNIKHIFYINTSCDPHIISIDFLMHRTCKSLFFVVRKCIVLPAAFAVCSKTNQIFLCICQYRLILVKCRAIITAIQYYLINFFDIGRI